MPFVNFVAGTVLTEANLDTMFRQGVMTFASTAARDAALSGSLAEGMVTYQTDTDQFTAYTGAAWVTFGGISGWTSYTPSLTSITLGTGGTSVGSYRLMGRFCEIQFRVILGTSGSFGAGPTVSLPVTASNDIGQETGSVVYYDASGAATGRTRGAMYSSTSTVVGLYDASGVVLSATTPFTWTVGDKVFGKLTVETT